MASQNMSNTKQCGKVISMNHVSFVWNGVVFAAPQALEDNLRKAGIEIKVLGQGEEALK